MLALFFGYEEGMTFPRPFSNLKKTVENDLFIFLFGSKVFPSIMRTKQDNPCHIDQRLGAGLKRSSPRVVCVELIFGSKQLVVSQQLHWF